MRRLAALVTVGVLLVPLAAEAKQVPKSAYQRPGSTVLVSGGHAGEVPNGSSYFASISDDGRHVAFASNASNLVPGDTNGWDDIFVRDLISGEIELISDGADGPANQTAMQPAISGNGRFVVFLSWATNMLRNRTSDWRFATAYVHDLQTGSTESVQVSLSGGFSEGGALRPDISDDGRYVVFHSAAADLVPGDSNNFADVFMFDRETRTTTNVSETFDGSVADGSSTSPEISGDGRFVTFFSKSTKIVDGDENGVGDLFIRDMHSGAVELVSVATDGTQGDQDSSLAAALTPDGRFVAFQSLASNLVPNDTNGAEKVTYGGDIFLRDRVAGTTERVGVTSAGGQLSRVNYPSLSDDGRYVYFHAAKPGIDQSDFSYSTDLYVHDNVTGSTELLSATPSGEPALGENENPEVSSDGRLIVFQSTSDGLATGGGSSLDVFVRDRGPRIGISDLDVDDATISGRVTLDGVLVTSSEDPIDAQGSEVPGTELTGASVSYRPESADLFFRIDVPDMPSFGSNVFGTPAISYVTAFDLAGVPHEVRIDRVGGADVAPAFTLVRCDEMPCVPVAELAGGYGETAAAVTFSLPLVLLGSAEELADVRISSGIGAAPLGIIRSIDELDVGAIAVPGIEATVDIDGAMTELELERGTFLLTTSGGLKGKRITGRVCVANICGERSTTIP